MQSIDMEFVQNMLASFQELQRSHAALQKQMADFVIEANRKLLVKNSGEENDTALYEQFLAEEEEKIGSGK